jgi:hypothetical protein
LEEKVAGPVWKTEIMAVRIRHADDATPFIRKTYQKAHIFRRSVTLQNGDTKLSVAGVIRSSCFHIFQ